MSKSLKVGIIGASADRGWAKVSHVPAVQQLAGLELAAVASGSQSKSEAAAKAFGAKAAYGDAKDLFRDPNIDIVSICVKVPDHRELVLGALTAGKHIYCEWPLGRNIVEAEELAGAAKAAGVHVAIGLQMRANPAAQHARDLVASGAIGRPLNARIISNTAAFGPKVEPAMAFAENASNGVTLVSIQGAHTLDLALSVLGPFDNLSALTTTQYPEIEVSNNAKRQVRSIPDHLLVQSRLANSCALSVEVSGGRPPEAPFRMEITGEEGELRLDGGALRGFQSGRLHISLNGKSQQVDEAEIASMPDEAANVASLYAALRNDILHRTSTTPDFQHAARLTRLIDDVLSSAATGARKPAADWPSQ